MLSMSIDIIREFETTRSYGFLTGLFLLLLAGPSLEKEKSGVTQRPASLECPASSSTTSNAELTSGGVS